MLMDFDRQHFQGYSSKPLVCIYAQSTDRLCQSSSMTMSCIIKEKLWSMIIDELSRDTSPIGASSYGAPNIKPLSKSCRILRSSFLYCSNTSAICCAGTPFARSRSKNFLRLICQVIISKFCELYRFALRQPVSILTGTISFDSSTTQSFFASTIAVYNQLTKIKKYN